MFQTAKEKLKAQTNQAIRDLMLGVAGDEILLLEVVAGGPHHWRRSFMRTFRGMPVSLEIADRLFAFFSQRALQMYGQKAGAVLDKMDIKSPPTQREIDQAWTVESESSEDGRRYCYGPDGHPEELITKLVQH